MVAIPGTGATACASLSGMASSDRPNILVRLLPVLGRDLQPWSRANLIAGLTVTAYLVPQVMAYATVAGLPAIVGLWAAVPALLVYPFLGTSRLLSLGPESSVALMTAAVVAPLALGDPARYVALAATIAITVGGIGLLASVLRLGFIGDLLSQPVLVGYMAGIGVLMIDGQIDHFLGIQTASPDFLGHVREISDLIVSGGVDPVVLALGSVILVMLYLLAWRRPSWPGPLLAILGGSLLALLINNGGGDIPIVGPVPQGLPTPQIPQVAAADVSALAIGAAGILLVGFTDVTLTGRAFLSRGDPRPDTDAELRAVAVGNLGVGLLQGMPVSSSGSRTALAKSSGATSQGYSLVVALGVVLVLLFAGPLLSAAPRAGLAALVIYAALHLIDIRAFAALWRFSTVEFVLAVVTMVGVLVVGILYGVLIAVGLSVLAMAARVARPHSAALGLVPGLPGMHDVGDFEEANEVPGLLIYRYDSPVFFANSQDFIEQANALMADRQPGLRWFALNCEAIVDIDATAVESLRTLMREVDSAGMQFCLVRAKRELVEQLQRAGLAQRIGMDRMYPTLPSLVEAYKAEAP